MVITCSDVTQILTIEQLKRENEFKSMVLRTASHEMRTPINAITYYSEIVKKDDSLS